MLIYQLITILLRPFLKPYLRKRVQKGKEDPKRLQERFGIPSKERPNGPVIWIHVASVGEALSIASLIEHLKNQHPNHTLLITSGTVSSAQLITQRYSVIHQYIPLDIQSWVKKFLTFWSPCIGLIVESELWPNLLKQAHHQAIPLILINGRLSKRSFKRWGKYHLTRRLFQKISSFFNVLFVQSKETQQFYETLNVPNTRFEGNLKFAAPLLPYSSDELENLQQSIKDRPVWLAASTHPGEEKQIFDIHQKLLKDFPHLLTIIAPRHPERKREILKISPWPIACRSKKDPLTYTTPLYLADTLGELGLFYRLCPIVFMGGTLVPVGGHNIIEPAQLGCCVLWGPMMDNFTEVCDKLAPGGYPVLDKNELYKKLKLLLSSPETVQEKGRVAQELVASEKNHLLSIIGTEIDTLLNQVSHGNE